MKLVMMAAALMLGGAAAAQSTDTAPGNMPIAGQPVAPGNGSPETDARGIPVVSAPAAAPAGYNQPARTMEPGAPMPAAMGPAPSMGSAGPLPPCTRTVTDRCTQTYERGRAR